MKSNRYIRQTNLKGFGTAAQEKLANARVLVVGLGGLGIPVLQYLNAMGVGTLGLVEQDVVELSNLQRQVLYTENDIGRNKIDVALEKLQAQNSNTNFSVFDTFLTKENALEIIKDFDVVVDATDNFPTRYLINDACVILKKPFVYGALHSFEGQVSVFNYKGGPTYRCLFPIMPSAAEIPNCNDNGVLGIIPGILGNLQALEAIKIITSLDEVMIGKLLIYNGLNQSINKINFKLNPKNIAITELQKEYGNVYCSVEKNITAEALQQQLAVDNNIQIIDVRTPNEFATFHIEGSINIPLNDIENSYSKINFDKSVHIICQSGKRSIAAIELLEEIKPADYINIEDGMNAYLELPV